MKTLEDWPKVYREKFGIEPLTTDRYAYIDVAMAFSESFSDGVFFGFMQEKGIDTAELAAYQMHRDEGFPFLKRAESEE